VVGQFASDSLTQLILSVVLIGTAAIFVVIRRPFRFSERNVGLVAVFSATLLGAFAAYGGEEWNEDPATVAALSYAAATMLLAFLAGAALLTLYHFLVYKLLLRGAGWSPGVEYAFSS